MTVPTSVIAIAVRHCEPSVSNPTRHNPPANAARIATWSGRGANGRRSVPAPRLGRERPWKYRASTITRNGRASLTPGIGPVPAWGNQSLVPRNPNQDWVIVIPNAAAVVTQKELNRPRSAAASAGTISSVTVKGSMKLLTEAARMPKAPVRTVDRIQLVPASRSGENPMSIAAFWFSAAARVARPKRM